MTCGVCVEPGRVSDCERAKGSVGLIWAEIPQKRGKQMKRKKEVALLLTTAVLAAAGCADEKTTGEKNQTESGSAAAVSGSSVFDR